MKFDEFMNTVLASFPNAEVDFDNEGQLIIYTGLRIASDDTVYRMDDITLETT